MDEKLNNVIIPPLQYYVTAASFFIFGESTFHARFPFALMGLCSFLFFFLINKELFRHRNLILINMVIFTTNIAFILYMRQCRYYAPTALFFLINVYLLIRYFNRPQKRLLLFYFLSSVLLFVSQYNAATAIFATLALVYAYFSKWNFKGKDLIAFVLTNFAILVFVLLFLFFHSPFSNVSNYSNKGFDVGYKLYVFYRSFISFDTFAFLSFPLFFVFLYFQKKLIGKRSEAVTYLFYFLVLNLFVFSLFSIRYAIRYIVYLIPVALILEGYILYKMCNWPIKYARHIAAGVLVLLVFTSTLFISTGKEAEVKLLGVGINSHFVDYLDEINSENPTTYSMLIDYLKSINEENKKVLVQPVFMSCPLIFYTGNQYLFLNQVGKDKKIDNGINLPAYVFNDEVEPDYLIVCGPDILKKEEFLSKFKSKYRFERCIDFYYRDTTRPEYDWRDFDVYTGYDPKTEAIYIFKKDV